MAISLVSLRKAVYDWFKASQAAGTVYAAVAGRLYSGGSVPEGKALTWPFIVFDVVTSNPGHTFSTTVEELRVQFSIFTKDDPDGIDVELIATKLRTRFDKAALTYSGSDYTNIYCKPDQGVGPMPANPDESDKRSMYTQDYLLRAEEV